MRDHEGLEQLRSSGLNLGERPYDFYTLETAEDLTVLSTLLKRHRDSSGRHPCFVMNFILANPYFAKMSAASWQHIDLVPLAQGLPPGWNRPGLFDAYKQGIADGVFYPALHGSTHFCRSAVERNLSGDGKRAELLRTLWQAGTPYIHWRMPWIGYEYWDPEKPEDQRMMAAEIQQKTIGEAVGWFAKMFSTLPRSACAPGYRANDSTHRAWAQHGIRVAQNGPGSNAPPHFDRFEILQLSRNVEFEPAIDTSFSVELCLQQAERAFASGLPAIVSVHSINFHSTVQDFRTPTLKALDEFLTALESKYNNLLYLHDDALYELVSKGLDQTSESAAQANATDANATRKKFTKRGLAAQKTQREEQP